VTDQMTFVDAGTPLRMRHGTALEVPPDMVAALRRVPVPETIPAK